MGAAPFRQADLTRAIKAAKAAGMNIRRCEILPDGRIVLTEEAPAADDPYAAWKAKREAGAKRSA